MNCQHCGKGFSDVTEFEAHSSWHTEQQVKLQRGRTRRYSAHKRPRSSSTNRSTSLRSDGSAPNRAESATTVDSPQTSSKEPRENISLTSTEPKTPAFDFNFDLGTISSITPISGSSLPTIKSLDDVEARFPAFEVEPTEDQTRAIRDYKCTDCPAFFSTQKDCDLHNQSRFCPGSAAVAFVLYRDLRQPGAYRVDKKYLPFNAYQSRMKCPKCHLSFSERLLKKVHERSHPEGHLACLHCRKTFRTTTELESHYEWHDDMEYRHHRDKCRRKLPGLKLQSESPRIGLSKTGVSDFGRKSVLLANEDPNSVPENSLSEGIEQPHSSDPEEEPIAISFISAEDLERIYAPNGVFREIKSGYLKVPEGSRPSSVANAPDSLEGESTGSRAAPAIVATLVADDESPGHAGPQCPNANSTQKRSSLRALFSRTKSQPQLESNRKNMLSFRKAPRRDSTADDNPTFDSRLMLNALLQRVSTAANKGDLQTIRKQCDQLMAIELPPASDIDLNAIPVQAFVHAGGTLVHDAAGNQRYLTSETVDEITIGLRRIPTTTLAKNRVSVLSTRAYLSSQEGNFVDGIWCYRQVMHILRAQPMLFPDGIWQAAILSNLAHLAARLDRPQDEEKYYLKALAVSYHRYGRNDLNNINFLRALAAAYERQEQTNKAAEVYKRSLFARMQISGPADRDTWMAMQDLAAIYCRLGNLTLAKLLYEQCLAGFEDQLGLGHKVTLLIIDRLCDIYVQEQCYEEALTLYARAVPFLGGIFGPDDDLPRTWVSRYIEHTHNYDFPPAISQLLLYYHDVPNKENLWVLQSLARAYMLAGLLADASEIFQFVYDARLRLPQEEYSSVTLDALHGHCLALECMDRLDAADSAYMNLIQLSMRSPDKNKGRSRALKLNNRLIALQERKKLLAEEQEAWDLGKSSAGPCGTCRYETTRLCPRCRVSRFCCDACRDMAARSHDQACHPSVTLCQSKSVTTIPGVPAQLEREALDRLSYWNKRRKEGGTRHRVADTFTLDFDPRNFITFRIKLNRAVNTFISFDQGADVRIGVLDSGESNEKLELHSAPRQTPSPDPTEASLKDNSPHSPTAKTRDKEDIDSSPSSSPTSLENEDRDRARAPSSIPTPSINTTISTATTTIAASKSSKVHNNSPFSWTTPSDTESLLIPKVTEAEQQRGSSRDVYLVIAPGLAMFQGMLERRRKLRRRDSADWHGSSSWLMMGVPSQAMIEYTQGLVLDGAAGGHDRGPVLTRRLAYLIEVAG